MANPRLAKSGIEENTLAILDSSGVRDARYILDDKFSFLDAVRVHCLHSVCSTAPTWKMYDAIFRMFWDKDASLELVVACHLLLTELDQRYRRVYVDEAGDPLISRRRSREVVVLKEAWSPFGLGSNVGQTEGVGGMFLVDSADLFILVQEVAKAVNDAGCLPSTKLVRKMLLVHYLFSVVERDFLARQTAYTETMNWVLMRESLLNMLLGSRRLDFKSFVKDCISIINKGFRTFKGSDRTCTRCTVDKIALFFGSSEPEKKMCAAVQKLLVLVMELDAIKKEADTLHLTSRADAVRTPALELIMDELTYHKDGLSKFLQDFSQNEWKLEIVLQHVWKYCSKPAVRTRKTRSLEDDTTLESLLSYLLNPTNMKNLTRKIGIKEVEILLSHAFEAHLSMNCSNRDIGSSHERLANSSLLKTCSDFISIFQNIRKCSRDGGVSSSGRGAFHMATLLVSRLS